MKKRMSLKVKLLLCFLVVTIISNLPILYAETMLKKINANYSYTLVNDGFSQGDLGKIMLSLAKANGYVHDISSYERQTDLDAAKANYKEEIETYNKYVKLVEKTLVSDDNIKMYNDAVAVTEEFIKECDELIAAFGVLDNANIPEYIEIEKKLINVLNPLYDESYNGWNTLLESKVKYGDLINTTLDKQATRTYFINFIISGVLIVFAVIFGTLAANSICNPIVACVDRIKLLSKGDLKTEVPVVNRNDELGDLSKALTTVVYDLNQIIEDERFILGKMTQGDFDVDTRCEESYVGDFEEIIVSLRMIINGLSEMLTEIDVASEHVTVGSEQVASGAQELAQGATEQASAIEQLNATIASIADQIKENAENAKNASNIASESSHEVEEGNRKMNEMIAAMTEITETSDKIAKIIKTIDDIAFQTNILALNAAVEAARAGEAGKGFAVVADEVRNLAGKSAEAAQNTTQLIESSINAVSNGTKIADLTAEALQNVVKATEKSTELINQIATASGEQAKSAEEATKGLDQISTVVQTNSATSEESAAASEELSAQANKMRELISQFKLKRNNKQHNKTNKNYKKTSRRREVQDDVGFEYATEIDLGEPDNQSYGNKY